MVFIFLSMGVISFYNEVIVEIPLGIRSGFDFSLLFLFDFYSMVFFRFVMLISSVVIIYIKYYIAGDNRELRFSVLVLLFVISIGVLILRPSILRIMVG
jgi:NADH:ubiquinone oxidoreductase subunit 5 (subunit L)/multisubunit Na+/H+ antiporter MnhA subunit